MYYTKAITLFLTFSIIIPLCCCWGTGPLGIDNAPEKVHNCCPDTASDTDPKNRNNDSNCEHNNLNNLLADTLVIDGNQTNLHPPVFEPTYALSDYHRLTPPFEYVARQLNCVSNAPPLLEVHCVYLL